jgi:hypothetical protein
MLYNVDIIRTIKSRKNSLLYKKAEFVLKTNSADEK